MAILTVSSTNPKFSFVICKNPTTIKNSGSPLSWSLRRGYIYGWFVNGSEQSFRLWFKDHPTETSFADGVRGEFEYLDKTRYSSPYLPIMMIQTALSTCAKNRQEMDGDGYEATATTTIKVAGDNTLLQLVQHYKASATITLNPICDNYCEVNVTSPTVFQTLNILQVICVLMAMRDRESYVILDRAGVDKYIRVLNNSDAPYYVRYLFGSRAVNNRHMFDAIKDRLQGQNMVLNFGDTRQQRYDAIQKELAGGGGTLLDIGCGELFYSSRLRNRYDSVLAVDADEELAEANRRKAESRNMDNVQAVFGKVTPEWLAESVDITENFDVLATEVLEHMPEEDSDALLQALLTTKARKVVVTVPNANFNNNYGLGEEFRHPDHCFEPTFEDWCDYTVTLAAKYGWKVNNVPVGDVVNDQSVTTMSVFTR